jgi:hypothetical protein
MGRTFPQDASQKNSPWPTDIHLDSLLNLRVDPLRLVYSVDYRYARGNMFLMIQNVSHCIQNTTVCILYDTVLYL